MKYIIATITILFSSLSFAMSEDSIFVAENEDGGYIYLLSEECPIDGSKGARISLILMPDFIVYGCWFYYEESIYAVWLLDDGAIRGKYDPEDFSLEKSL